MEKSIQISMLLEIYGNLLTDKQKDVADLYYNDNLSLGEIADELKITRQGVRKILVDAENKLYDYEDKLQLMKNRQEQQEQLTTIIDKVKDNNIKEELQNYKDRYLA